MYDNVLITGVKGFICSNLLCFLVNRYPNTRFIGIDCESYCSVDDNICNALERDNFEYIKLDLSHRESVTQLFSEKIINTVIHLAAYSHVDRSFADPDEFFVNNVIGTYNLLEESRKHGVVKFIHMSTDEVYGDKYLIADENTALNPTNPYSGSKACCDQMIISYINGFKFPAIILRCNNVYGIKQYPEKVIPRFITNMLNKKNCQIHGTGDQRRSFLHVDDFCTAFDIVLNRSENGEIYNIGSEEDISIRDLFYLIRDSIDILFPKLCISSIEPEYIEDRQYNDQHYTINCDKIKSLGWQPKVNINESIGELICFYVKKAF